MASWLTVPAEFLAYTLPKYMKIISFCDTVHDVTAWKALAF
jgi:hypothetical protein